MDERKRKQVTIRMNDEDWRAIRDAAFAAGKEIGPFVAEWIRPRLDRLKAHTKIVEGLRIDRSFETE